jgi:hypothetical protein
MKEILSNLILFNAIVIESSGGRWHPRKPGQIDARSKKRLFFVV